MEIIHIIKKNRNENEGLFNLKNIQADNNQIISPLSSMNNLFFKLKHVLTLVNCLGRSLNCTLPCIFL
jgi:hypothetical protein